MEKNKNIFSILICIIICILLFNNKAKSTIIKESITKKNIVPEIEERPIGKINIPKINLNKPLYKITSQKNNIEENVTILNGTIEPTQENSIIFLAAHSGPGPIAFFNDLDQLTINDLIILEYNKINYTYIIKNIWETSKDGNIEVIKEKENQLILTTCSKNNSKKQLLINSIKKES